MKTIGDMTPAELQRFVINNVLADPASIPKRAPTPEVLYPDFYHLGGQGGFEPNNATPGAWIRYNYDATNGVATKEQVFQSSGTQGDFMEWMLVLRPGRWRTYIEHEQEINRGFYHVYHDGAQIAAIDGFENGPVTARQVGFGATIIGDVRRVKVRLAMDSKNGSSSGYYGVFRDFGLVRDIDGF